MLYDLHFHFLRFKLFQFSFDALTQLNLHANFNLNSRVKELCTKLSNFIKLVV